ncbi:MAG: hypothetical protein KAT68_14110, partial [Bacteroidales bacterium]|nr:hypothetical protein [Bacteroidales bacterium]
VMIPNWYKTIMQYDYIFLFYAILINRKIITMKIKKRLILLTLITLISGFLYVPFIKVSSETTNIVWIVFPFGSALVILLLTWLGIKLSDKTQLPMPILRKWENNERIKFKDGKILLIPLLIGGIFALVTYGLNQYFNPPENPGNFLERILTTPWAALVTETISHLLIMSAIVLLLKKNWLGIIISSLLFLVIFHLNSIEGDLVLTTYLGTMNFIGVTITGWIYSKYGFESAVISHASMHLIILGLN